MWLCHKEGSGGLMAPLDLGGESSSGVGFVSGPGIDLAGGKRWFW